MKLQHTSIVELDCALLPKSIDVLDVSQCRNLERILNLDQLSNLTILNITGTPIASLPRLPNSLTCLNAKQCPNLTTLPVLEQTNLRSLTLYRTPVENLPHLPSTLSLLNIHKTKVRGEGFPMIPDSVTYLDIDYTPAVKDGFLPNRMDGEQYADYANRVRTLWKGCSHKEKFALFHEELIVATWHPDRFEQWCLDIEEKKENEMMMVF